MQEVYTMPDLEGLQRDKATILRIIKYTLYILIIGIVVYYGFRLVIIMLPFIIGFVLAKVASMLAKRWLNLVYRIRHRKSKDSTAQNQGLRKYPRGLAKSKKEITVAIVIYIIEVIIVTIMIVGIFIGAFNQLRSLAAFLPDFVAKSDIFGRISALINDFSITLGGFLDTEFITAINEQLTAFKSQIVQAVPDIATSILSGLADFAGYLPILILIIIVVIMSGYYFIADSRRLFLFIRRNITSSDFRKKTLRLIDSLLTTLFRVVGGYLFLLALTFAEAFIGLTLIGMRYSVIFALIAAVVDFLPVLGVSATLIPIAVYLFITGNIAGGLGTIVLLAVMTVVRRFVEPAVLGTALRLHPMATLVAMIVGIGLYGLGGIIIGPIIMVIAREVLTFYGFDTRIRSTFGEIVNNVGKNSEKAKASKKTDQ